MNLATPILLSTLTLAAAVAAQERASTTTKIGSGTVTIDYQPFERKGRTPEKDLPAGMVWRMGANEAAQLTTDVPLLFGSAVLPPGKHRLSARHDGKGKWEVLAFQGVPFHDPAVHHVLLPVKFAEEKDAVEELTIAASTDSGQKDNGTIQFRLGTYSLTMAPRALTTTKVDGTLGGKPAEFVFYNLPSSRDTHRCIQRGDMLRVGTARQTGDDGVTFAIYGKRVDTQSNDVNLVFVNEPLQCGKGAIEANNKTIAMLKEYLDQVPAEQAKGMQGFIDSLNKEVEKTKKAVAAAEKLPAKVEIEGEVQTGQKAANSMLVSTEKADGGLVVNLHLGQGSAKFNVTEASFKK